MYTINIKPAQKGGFCAFFRKNRLSGFFAFGGNRFIKRTVVDELLRFIGGLVKLFFQGQGGGVQVCIVLHADSFAVHQGGFAKGERPAVN